MEIVTLKEARERGLRFYYTGEPCKYGHIGQRLASGQKCYECFLIYKDDPDNKKRAVERAVAWAKANQDRANATKKRWVENNKEKKLASSKKWHRANAHKEVIYKKKWRKDNKDRLDETNRKWREKNKERYLSLQRKWRENNPERHIRIMRNADKRRRLRERSNGGEFTQADIDALFVRHKGKCGNCHVKTDKLQIDHIVPVAKGGTCDPRNLQLLCASCNARKNAKDPLVWARENGRLL